MPAAASHFWMKRGISAVGLGCVKTPLAEALTNRDFGELTVFVHLAVFGGLFCLESS